MNKQNIRLFRRCLAMAGATLIPMLSSAQNGYVDFNSVISSSTTQARTNIKSAVGIIQIAIIAIALVMLAWAFYKRSKADGQSNDAIMTVIVTLVVVLIVIEILKQVFLK